MLCDKPLDIYFAILPLGIVISVNVELFDVCDDPIPKQPR